MSRSIDTSGVCISVCVCVCVCVGLFIIWLFILKPPLIIDVISKWIPLLCDRLFFFFLYLFLIPPGFYTVGRTRQPKEGKCCYLLLILFSAEHCGPKKTELLPQPPLLLSFFFSPTSLLSPRRVEEKWLRGECHDCFLFKYWRKQCRLLRLSFM